MGYYINYNMLHAQATEGSDSCAGVCRDNAVAATAGLETHGSRQLAGRSAGDRTRATLAGSRFLLGVWELLCCAMINATPQDWLVLYEASWDHTRWLSNSHSD
jgi:hypothetical protein